MYQSVVQVNKLILNCQVKGLTYTILKVDMRLLSYVHSEQCADCYSTH